MNPVKIAAIVLIISAGLVGSYFIIKNSTSPLPSSQTQGVSALTPPIQNPLKWVENTVKSLADNFLVERGANIKTENEDTVNLTELVAQAMFNKMRSLDEEGKNPFEGQGFDLNDPKNQKLLQETVASIRDPSTIFNPKIEDKNLKISSDNSKEAKLVYLNSMQKIGQEYFSDPSFQREAEQIMKDIQLDCLGSGNTINSKMASAYNDIATNYLNISVPSDWSNLHKELITHFKKGYLIFEAITNCVKDPIKGYVAAETLFQFGYENQIVREALKRKLVEVGLLP